MAPESVPRVGKGSMILDRLTIDLDSYESNFAMRALRAYHGLRRLDFVENIVVHISTSGRGIHLEGHLTEVLEDDRRHELRRSLCDDSKRTNLDEQRGAVGHATEICWSEKEGNDGEREEMPDIWSALDRIEALRADDHSRVKALAQHGRKAVWDTHGLNRASLADL